MHRATHHRRLVVSTIVAWGLACTACSGSEVAAAACSHDRDCPTGDTCAEGVCKTPCGSDADCGPTSCVAEGATRNVCVDGMCTTTSCSEADADNDGFGETVDCDDDDATVFPGAEDLPDPDFIDADCDGIDGSVDAAVFVSTDGDDASPGTVAAPVRSIQHAIDLAAADAVRWLVLVAAGTYTEALIVPDGVSLFGGYASPAWDRGDDNETLIDAPSLLAVHVRDTTINGHLEGFTIRSRDAAVGEGSSIAVGLQGLGQSFYVRYNRLEAGRGGDGTAGSSGARGAGGAAGGPGTGGDGGAGGAAGGSDAGAGGGGGGPLGGGGAGAPGSSGRGGVGGAVGANGASGGSAPPAAHGAVPADQALGTQVDMGWVALGGGAGARGASGGGGGGGGTGVCWCGIFCPTGGGGGGGGGGGSPGGLGGSGGSGSFGLFAVDAGPAIITDNAIVTAGGGTGGAGGDGGLEGAGGAGGRGALCWGLENGSGGEGGRGGSGGHGGGGAGGAGGMSVGVFQTASPGLTLGRNAIELGAAGAGGVGGHNGSSRAATGENGVRAEHLVYD